MTTVETVTISLNTFNEMKHMFDLRKELLHELTAIRGWFYYHLINPDNTTLDRETAGRVLEDLQKLINKVEKK